MTTFLDFLVNAMIIQPFWKAATHWWGMRNLARTLQKRLPGAYGNTVFHFETSEPVVALTIDDGLSRGGPATSMAAPVQRLLQQYQARATFFVCTDYIQQGGAHEEEAVRVRALLDDGHEWGNHLQSDDRSLGHYSRLSEQDFRRALLDANAILDRLEHQHQHQHHHNGGTTTSQRNEDDEDEEGGPSTTIRWFRAPQGVMTARMRQIVDKQGNMKHVLGDCYCDDWRFAEQVDSSTDDNNTDDDTVEKRQRTMMKPVAELMLAQAQPGSIAIFHMPERGFREATIYALEYFLQGLQEKGWRCVNLSEMHRLCVRTKKNANDDDERYPDP